MEKAEDLLLQITHCAEKNECPKCFNAITVTMKYSNEDKQLVTDTHFECDACGFCVGFGTPPLGFGTPSS